MEFKKAEESYIKDILDHCFYEYTGSSNYGMPKASDEEFERVYGLKVACTAGYSNKEYEEVYNQDNVITDKNAYDPEYMEDYLRNDISYAELKEIHDSIIDKTNDKVIEKTKEVERD